MPYTYSTDSLVKPPVLFGRRLRPLTLGHAMVLNALEHPALMNEQLNLSELAVAVWVCSVPWKKAQKMIRNGSSHRALFWMGLRYRIRRGGFKEAVLAFDEYRRFYIDGPPRWETGDGGSAGAVPWFLTLFCAVQKHTNLTANETWNLPVKFAAEICAGIGELNGDTTLMSEEEQNFVGSE